MKSLWPVSLADFCQPRAQLFIRRRAGKKGLAQGAKIEASAADENCCATTGFYLGNLIIGRANPISGSKRDGRRNKIDQMMRNSAALFQRHFSGRNLNFPIDLNGIAVDDFAVEAQRDLNSKFAFPGSSGANNCDDVAQIVNLPFIVWIEAGGFVQ